MKIKSFFYNEPDGVHYPDAMRGVSYLYGMDFSSFLGEHDGTLVSVDWDLEEGLVGSGAFNVEGSPNIACINIEAKYSGTFQVKAIMNYIACGIEQKLEVPIMIKVY